MEATERDKENLLARRERSKRKVRSRGGNYTLGGSSSSSVSKRRHRQRRKDESKNKTIVVSPRHSKPMRKIIQHKSRGGYYLS